MLTVSEGFSSQVSTIIQCYKEEGAEVFNGLETVPLQSVVFQAQSDFDMLGEIAVGLSFNSTLANSIMLNCNYPMTRGDLQEALDHMKVRFPEIHFCSLVIE